MTGMEDGTARPRSGLEQARRLRDVRDAMKRLSAGLERHGNSTDRIVNQVCHDAYLAADFVHGTTHVNDAGVQLRLRGDEDFVKAMERLGEHALPLEGILGLLATTSSPTELHPRLRTLSTSFRRDLGSAVEAFVRVVKQATIHDHADKPWRTAALQLADRIRTSLYMHNDRAELEETRREAGVILKETSALARFTRKMASESATNELAEFFHKDSARETKTANRLRGSAVAALVAVTAIAVFLLLSRTDATTVAGELLKLSLTIPVAGLSAYLAHESSRHRTAARSSAELAIALNTLPGYIAALEDGEGARDLRRALGMRIFAEPREPGTSDADPQTNVVDDVHRILMRIEALLGGGRSGL